MVHAMSRACACTSSPPRCCSRGGVSAAPVGPNRLPRGYAVPSAQPGRRRGGATAMKEMVSGGVPLSLGSGTDSRRSSMPVYPAATGSLREGCDPSDQLLGTRIPPGARLPVPSRAERPSRYPWLRRRRAYEWLTSRPAPAARNRTYVARLSSSNAQVGPIPRISRIGFGAFAAFSSGAIATRAVERPALRLRRDLRQRDPSMVPGRAFRATFHPELDALPRPRARLPFLTSDRLRRSASVDHVAS